MAHTNQFKQFTVKAPYEDNSGYAIFSYVVFDDNNLINSWIIPNTSRSIPKTNDADTALAQLKNNYNLDFNIITPYNSVFHDSNLYPNWSLTLQQGIKVEKVASMYPNMKAPNIDVKYDKTFIINNHKYRLHLVYQSGSIYYANFQYYDVNNSSWVDFGIINQPLSNIYAYTFMLRCSDLDDISNTISTNQIYYLYGYYNMPSLIDLYLSVHTSLNYSVPTDFITDLLSLDPITPGEDPYAPDPETLPSDTIGDDIATGYMQYGDTNMFTIFVPSQQQIQDFAAQMYGQDLFTWLQGLGLSLQGVNNDIMNFYVLPTKVTATGTKYISGNRIPINSSVEMDYTNTNYIIVDCGSVTIPKLYDNFLDYTSQIQIYLPFVGYQSLDTEDVMGKTIGVTYRIDLLTGDAAIAIKVDGSVMYQFQGNTAYGLPGSADHYSDIISKGLTAATMIAVGKSAMNAGQTQLNQAEVLYGEGKLNAAEASKMAATGEKEIARGQAMRQKAVGDLSNIKFGGSTRSGAMGGNTGLLSVIKPYLIIKRPKVEVPSNYSVYNGYPCNKYLNLGSLSGYSEIEDIHIEGINATLGELEEIESLLKAGVTF